MVTRRRPPGPSYGGVIDAALAGESEVEAVEQRELARR